MTGRSLAAVALAATTAVACAPPALASYYDRDVIAQTGGVTGLESMDSGPSVNALGDVAFVGRLGAGQGVFVGDGTGEPLNITPGRLRPTVSFGASVEINDGRRVLAREEVAAGAGVPRRQFLRVWDGRPGHPDTILRDVASSDLADPPPDWDSVISQAAMNHRQGGDDTVVFSAARSGIFHLVTSSGGDLPLLPMLRPAISDDDRVVVRAGNQPGSPVLLYPSAALTTPLSLAGSSQGFTRLGQMPGISSTGGVAVFAGDRGQGTGIFASFVDQSGVRRRLTIAGESWNGSDCTRAELGTQGGVPLCFSDIQVDSRVGVTYAAAGPDGIDGDGFVVSFIATPSGASTSVPAFSATKGLWTVRVDVDGTPAPPPGELACGQPALTGVRCHAAQPVAQVGADVGGHEIADLGVYDPIAGVAAAARGAHRVAFWAATDGGDRIVRTTHEPARVRGRAYDDADVNGERGSGETLLADVAVFVDDDADGERDDGEQSVVTADDGSYVLDEVGLGERRVCQVVADERVPTRDACVPVTVLAGETEDADFGSIERASDFDWTMPPRYHIDPSGVDPSGIFEPDGPRQVKPDFWRVNFVTPEDAGDACRRALPRRWRIDDVAVPPQVGGPVFDYDDDGCSMTYGFPEEGTHELTLEILNTDGDVIDHTTQTVAVQNWLIVSLGDSVASGEGNPAAALPGTPTWRNAQCHRSERSGQALAAQAIEDDDPRTSVTFLNLACSGAGLRKGLVQAYAGIEPGRGSPLDPQLIAMAARAGGREIDAVLMSAGANDVFFGRIVQACFVLPNCPVLMDTYFRAHRRGLPGRYRKVAEALDAPPLAGLLPAASPAEPLRRVYLTEYHDPDTDEAGKFCEVPFVKRSGKRVPGMVITPREFEWASRTVVAGLNLSGRVASAQHGWHHIEGIATAFLGHGYCSTDAWVVTIPQSWAGQGNRNGAFHPGPRGHDEYARRIASALRHDLYPEDGDLTKPRPPKT